jgi:hypothetical protein
VLLAVGLLAIQRPRVERRLAAELVGSGLLDPSVADDVRHVAKRLRSHSRVQRAGLRRLAIEADEVRAGRLGMRAFLDSASTDPIAGWPAALGDSDLLRLFNLPDPGLPDRTAAPHDRASPEVQGEPTR